MTPLAMGLLAGSEVNVPFKPCVDELDQPRKSSRV
jgi:hypothetical protein